MSDLGEIGESLSPLINFLDGAGGGAGIIVGDVLEDVLKPALSFFGPRYRCHERMRCAICSFEMVRLASESATPRAIMIATTLALTRTDPPLSPLRARTAAAGSHSEFRMREGRGEALDVSRAHTDRARGGFPVADGRLQLRQHRRFGTVDKPE